MLARARERGGPVALEQARAEALPFEDGSFERVVFRLVVHLVDRPAAFSEAARVLVSGGRVVVATFAPEHFDSYWLSGCFPTVREIDRRRFPTAEELTGKLTGAGFRGVRARRLSQVGSLGRDEALERIRGRYISTLRLLSKYDFRAGLARAEAELPATIETRLEWLVLVAERP
jgi:SAM-dependent methyltransferase